MAHSPSPTSPAGAPKTPAQPERRGFLTVALAIVCGTIVGAVPALSGLAVFLSPWRRKREGEQMIRVASLDALPDDGIPRQFPVIAERFDAWNRSVEPIGAVYLRRTPGEKTPQCLTATCPHAGCFIAFDPQAKVYKCPCHNSSFQIDGAIIEPSPSPRAMDSLECKVDDQAVLVRFENFYTGKTDKVAKD